MSLSKEDNEATKAMVELLQRSGKEVKRPVRVRPELMDAFQRATRMKLTLNFDGYAVMLHEDPSAPEDIDAAVAEASKDDELPVMDSTFVRGPQCHQCGGPSVKLGDGTFICTGCSKQVTPPEPSKVVLASERAQLSKHSRNRRH